MHTDVLNEFYYCEYWIKILKLWEPEDRKVQNRCIVGIFVKFLAYIITLKVYYQQNGDSIGNDKRDTFELKGLKEIASRPD